MKLKMADKSLFAILLRKPWWVSIAIGLVIGLAGLALMHERNVPFLIFAGAPFLVIGIIAAFRQWGVPSATQTATTLQAANAMNWRDFSGAMESAFRRDGYEVARLGNAEADFAITRSGRTTLVGCKRWKASSNGIEPLRALQAAVEARDAQDGIFVATGAMTENARRFAKDNRIRVLEGSELARLLRGLAASKSAAK